MSKAFWAQVSKRASGCWEWRGAKTQGGYGSATIHGKSMGAHRAAFLLCKGEIPAGFVILHSCDNPPCCNPAHLRAGTRKENSQDMVAKGRHNNGQAMRRALRRANKPGEKALGLQGA